jgi:hypothetical protein
MTAQRTPDVELTDQEARAAAIRLRHALRARRPRRAARVLARRAC